MHQRARRAYGKRAVLTAVRFSVGCKKTTVFTAVLVLPCISEPAERTGIGLCQQPFDSPLGVKKRLSYSVVLVLPCISELAERTGIGTTERRLSIPSRDNKSRHKCVCLFGTPVYQRACRAYGNRDDGTPSFDSESGLKKRLSSQSFLVLPTGIEPITNP